MFTSLLIANRGEIACRIIDTARRLGVRSIAVYSEADREARHVRLADDARCIGPAAAIDSYLRIDRIVEAARDAKVEAVHPGYGFLSENADFAEACGKAGLIFVGPPPDAIRAMGSKSVAKDLMARAGVPVIPDYRGSDQSIEAFAREVDSIGYPVMLKPAHGGGGKGMRRVDRPDELADALEAAKREARAAFNNEEILAEKYVDRPRHVEVQVFGDAHGNVVHLFERDCTLQRRHQKIIEEAPAIALPMAMRADMHEAALRVAKAVNYQNAGTVEFLVDDAGAFYFMEMNTRLQVEHPVTECITGLDLVEWQLRVAAGEPLPLTQAQIVASGHAIEARLYAEAPDDGFLPSPGRISALSLASEDRVRLDTGVETGDVVQPHYDPMIAKIIVHGSDREQARRALLNTVAAAEVEGPETNLAFLATLLMSSAFAAGAVDIQFVDRELETLLPRREPPSAFAIAAVMAFLEAGEARPDDDPWSDRSGWQPNLPASRRMTIGTAGETRTATRFATSDSGTCRLVWADQEWAVTSRCNGQRVSVWVDGQPHRSMVVRSGDSLYVIGDADVERVDVVDPLIQAAATGAASGAVTSPMPGKLSAVLVAVGQKVSFGEKLAIVEAMKMEHVLRAAVDGVVTAVPQTAGAFVEEGSLLVEIEASA